MRNQVDNPLKCYPFNFQGIGGIPFLVKKIVRNWSFPQNTPCLLDIFFKLQGEATFILES